MGPILLFMRKKRRLAWLRGATPRWYFLLAAPAGLLVGAAIAVAVIYMPIPQWPTLPHSPTQSPEAQQQPGPTALPEPEPQPAPLPIARTFRLCFTGGGTNCVVD